MEEEDTKLCTNCKREIPAVNFTTHSVHCARNLRTCPACKEPVPVAQLQDHHDALHKEVPCKKCGESVCGTDLEDHIRDSCAQTIKPCRYCELELPRRQLPAHESYCGARSELCPDCGEYVMAKYRTLHLDSNHGFLRLDSDPTPKEAKPEPKPVINHIPTSSTSRNGASQARPFTAIRRLEAPGSSDWLDSSKSKPNGVPIPSTSRNGASQTRPVTEIRRLEAPGSSDRPDSSSRNGTKVTVKRTNDQPQINTSVQPAEKVNKQLPSRGAVQKRPAPAPPDARRDAAYRSAARRQRDEDERRRIQTAYNLSVGLPPVLSAAAKLDKLRKMDALHNREVEDQEYKNRLQGRVWMPPDVPVGHVLGREPARRDLSHLQPMSPAQFMDRFQELQLGGAGGAGGAGGGDRFSEIKSSLRELRRGLNEVTAPYNSAHNNASSTNYIDSTRPRVPSPPSPPRSDDDDAGAGALRLPCEFCGAAVLADDLVLHETGCRPDLTQYKRRSCSPARSPARARSRSPRPPARVPSLDDVIPCEFCTESLPFYLINEHQERCSRDSNYCDRC